MAAGLPSVISDWDGYRDLIEHEVQGFRIPTVMGRPGLGADLAVAHGNGWESYDHDVGIASMFVSVDVEAAADALTALFDNPDLRERMGAAARERARTVFDWKTVIGQYQGLWSELGAIRKAGAAKPAAGINPWRPDPFVLFNAYPTQSIDPAMFVTLSPGVTAATVKAMLRDATVAYTASFLLNEDEFDLVVAAMLGRGPAPVGAIAAVVAPLRRGVAERCLVWMAKFGLARLSAGPDAAGGQIAAAPGHL